MAHDPKPTIPTAADGDETPKPRNPAAPAKVERVPARPIEERWFEYRETMQMCHVGILRRDVLPEDCLRPGFWSMVSNKVSPMSKIIVYTEDRSWYGEMIVWATGIGFVEATFIHEPVQMPRRVRGISPFSDYEIRDLGEIQRWGVVRKSDGAVIHGDGSSKTPEQAQTWLAEYVRTQMNRSGSPVAA